MISYFPTPYENEVLYSIIARYHYHSAHNSKAETMLSLFGNKAKKFDVDIPSGVTLIVEKLKGVSKGLTADYFIENHSILPLFRQFMESNRYYKVLLKVKGKDKASIKMRTIHKLDDDVKRKEHLYFCKKCLKEQFETHGEGYWNRFHQIPGVFVCTKHKICLTKFPGYNFKKRWNNFIIPNVNDVYSNIGDIPVSDKSLEILLDIANDIEYLFNENLTIYPYQYYYEKYMELLKIHGIGYPEIKRKYLLAQKLLDFYPKEVLDLCNSYLSPDNPWCWTRNITEQNRIVNLHPIRHILIMRLLAGSVKEFYEKNYNYQPFGSGPWICMNHLAEHYLKECVDDLEINVHSAYRRVQGDFTCSCGFKYRLILPEKTPLEVNRFSHRIIERGDLWRNEFQKLLSKNLSIIEISHITKMSRPTVRKIKKQVFSGKKIMITRGTGRRKVCSDEIRTQNYKEEWEIIFKENPTLNRTQLKALNQAAFAWIKKNDEAWMEKHLPPVKWRSKNDDKYYIKMDNKLLQGAREAYSNWSIYEREKGRLQRITITGLLTHIGISTSVVIKKGHNYPLLKEFLESVIENKEKFQKRRIQHVLENKFISEIVTVSKIKDAASLYRKLNPEIEKYLEEQVELHNRLVKFKGIDL